MKAIALLALSIALEAGFLFTLTAPAPATVRAVPAAQVTTARAPQAPVAPLRRS
ncbi:hypothetical protein [Anaeromyxobacter oryzae]|uniref:Uncharacterized protein n=1 Tax=Anaeromyxobacter oryzae TaxID=2918170 RepID=A0ABM7WQQ6_9BACT|nr:hypothetical protein [Anaeromyxobacter oryzae]BDG01789.1 hypothetical protein AMOR_07850 [Anaeromyxobacter oryzae]